MINWFGLAQVGQNIIRSIGVGPNKFTKFWSGSGRHITGHYRVGVPKTLPRRTLVWIQHGKYIARLRWLYCLTIIGCNFVLNDLLHLTLISDETMDLGLPFHSCTFDDIMMTSSSFRGNPIFLIILCFCKMEPPIKFKLCKQHKHDNT